MQPVSKTHLFVPRTIPKLQLQSTKKLICLPLPLFPRDLPPAFLNLRSPRLTSFPRRLPLCLSLISRGIKCGHLFRSRHIIRSESIMSYSSCPYFCIWIVMYIFHYKSILAGHDGEPLSSRS